jgi:hypothetical protein
MLMQSGIPTHNYKYHGIFLWVSNADSGGNGNDRSFSLASPPGSAIVGGGGHGGTSTGTAQCNTSPMGNIDSSDNTCESCMFYGYLTSFVSGITCEGRGNASDGVAYAAASFAGVWHTDGIYDVAATNNHGSGATPNPLTINYAPGSVLVETGTSAINDGAVDVSTTTGFQELRSTNFSDTAPVTTALGYRPSGYQQSFGSVDPNAFNGWSNGAGTAYGLALQVYPYGHFGSTYPWGV